MQGIYELYRDNIQYPSCWFSNDNSCLPHFHSSIEIVYVTDGEFQATLNGKAYRVHKDQMLISSSYTIHYYSKIDHSDSIILIVPLDFIPSYSILLAQKVFAACIYDVKKPDSELLHCMQGILLQKKAGGNLNIIRGYIYVLLGMLIERMELIDIDKDESRSLIKEVLIYLQNNYRKKLTLGTLAQTFGYSKSRFSHIFNARFGCGILEYIDTLRCRHAAVMISHSSSLIDSALNSGFESMRTFYRCFKRCFGITPSEYRDRVMSSRSGAGKPSQTGN